MCIRDSTRSVTGSNPGAATTPERCVSISPVYPSKDGPLVKRLRHGPFTAVTWVRFPYGSIDENQVACKFSFLLSGSILFFALCCNCNIKYMQFLLFLYGEQWKTFQERTLIKVINNEAYLLYSALCCIPQSRKGACCFKRCNYAFHLYRAWTDN